MNFWSSRLEPFSWHMALLVEPTKILIKYAQFWHALKVENVFTIWKYRNVAIFSQVDMDTHVSMYFKCYQ